jgi:hypothetical protein
MNRPQVETNENYLFQLSVSRKKIRFCKWIMFTSPLLSLAKRKKAHHRLFCSFRRCEKETEINGAKALKKKK